ncbi:MAG: ABC transporter substrate-binding protein [Alphaproteobacteria bacterium]|jgi:putative ABC transport system substrate-binding protein|nr:ABC transporter substrate-binding protein [Alphaproteobacteria bacterium]MBP7729777.1 ABC transporter substrate-binding protein [Alphaproteobacteria bacterium]
MRFFFYWFLIVFFGWKSETFAEEQLHVAVGQIVEHPALDMLRESLKKGLEEKGFVEGKNLIWTYENAQGSPTTAVQIAHKLTSLNPNVIVTFSTPMTQAAAAATTVIPIVFGAVSDPVAAKLSGHKNVTGLTDFVPPQQQIDLIKSFIPDVKTIGVIFNSGEANSQKQVQDIKNIAELQDIKIMEVTVSKSAEVSTATKTLVGKVNAILLPTDNTVISALESIIKIGIHNKIPIFGSDIDIVRRGAVAAYGVNWRESGFTLAEMVSHILEGTSLEEIPIQNPQQLVFHINLRAAEKMGLHVPKNLQKKADLVL